MRQIKAILIKEIRQHWDIFSLLIIVQAFLAWLIVRGIENSESSVSVFEAVPGFTNLFMPISILLLSKRLFVSEYQEKTRDFLDGLPVGRGRMLTLKLFFALALLCLIFASLVLLVAYSGQDNQVVTLRFLAILLIRGFGYIVCGLGFCFMVSFTGRFRNMSYFLAILALFSIEFVTDISLNQTGPFSLVSSHTMPYERTSLPWEAFSQSIGFGLLCTAIGFFLALYRGGALIRALSGRMTLREKCAAGLGFLIFTGVINTVDLRRQKAPFDFVSENVIRSESGRVEVLYFEPEQKQKAARLQTWLEKKVLALEQTVLHRKSPPVRVVLSTRLDGHTFDPSTLSRRDGVMWRCNYLLEDFDQTRFGGLLFHSIINRSSRRMATYDPQHWFLDGFCHWWVEREQPERLLQAYWVQDQLGVTQQDVRDWSLLSDRVGSDQAESIGFSLVHHLETSFGEDTVLKLAEALYSRQPHYDVREAFVQWWNPATEDFQECTGQDFSKFLDSWLSHRSEEAGRALAKIPHFEAAFSFEQDSLVYRLSFQSPPPPDTIWSLSHTSLKPYDALVDVDSLKRVEHAWSAGKLEQEERLKNVYSPGQRVLLFVEVDLPQLRYPLQLPSKRLEVSQ